MPRQDFAYPFRIDAGAHQVAQANYSDHVAQMIREVLLTDPGERVCLPEFGCGLRRLVFAPYTDALKATTQLLVMQALSRWLAGQIQVSKVTVSSADEAPDGVLEIEIDYILIETRDQLKTTVQVR